MIQVSGNYKGKAFAERFKTADALVVWLRQCVDPSVRAADVKTYEITIRSVFNVDTPARSLEAVSSKGVNANVLRDMMVAHAEGWHTPPAGEPREFCPDCQEAHHAAR